jgi:hypothetical protein
LRAIQAKLFRSIFGIALLQWATIIGLGRGGRGKVCKPAVLAAISALAYNTLAKAMSVFALEL